MSDIGEVVVQKPEKRLKNTRFHLIDSALGCVGFIVFQLVFEIFYNILPLTIKANFVVSMLLSFLVEAVFAFAVLTVSKIRNVEFIKATRINKKPDWKSALLAVALSIICLFAFTGLTNTFVAFLEKIGYSQMISNITIPNFGVYVLFVFLMAVCPALFEEFLFRGLILSGLRDLGKNAAVFISALIFMLMHGGPDQTIHQFILGVVLGYAFVYSGSLWVPIIIHFINNFVALTSLYITSATGTLGETSETVMYSWLEIGLSLIYSLFIAAVGGVLVWLCIKALKKIKDKKEQANLAVLDKDNISQEDIDKLKATQEDNDIMQKGQKNNTATIIMFVLSGLYLVFNWLLTLIVGIIK